MAARISSRPTKSAPFISPSYSSSSFPVMAGCVDIAHARNHQLFAVTQGAPFGIRNNILHGRNRQPLTDSRTLINLLILARSEGNALDYLLNVHRQVHGVPV